MFKIDFSKNLKYLIEGPKRPRMECRNYKCEINIIAAAKKITLPPWSNIYLDITHIFVFKTLPIIFEIV